MAIKNTKEFVALFLGFCSTIINTSSDGKISATDLAYFIELLPKVGPGIKDFGLIRDELASLTPEEKQELQDYIVAEFDIENERVESLIETGLVAIVTFIDLLRNYRRAAT